MTKFIKGNWYQAETYLNNKYTHAELTDTTSSAGDWSGILIKKINTKEYGLFIFSQEWCSNEGYELSVNEKPTVVFSKKPNQKEIQETIQEIYQLY